MSIKIALAGNPNSGKTTLFNALTGANQFVGNWPGVTVEKKEGRFKFNQDITITDLPGIYSLSPYTLEEVVARDYLLEAAPDGILNIIDGTNLERNLYLTTQLLELGIPVVVAVNMMDVVEKNGDKIDIPALSRKLGCPVIKISALKNSGVKEAAEAAVKAAKGDLRPACCTFSAETEAALGSIAEELPEKMKEGQKRFFAIKLFERDEKVLKNRGLPNVEEIIEMAERAMEEDSESIITNERYLAVGRLLQGAYTKKNKGGLTLSDKIDAIITNRWLALPIFALIMALVYYISVSTVGAAMTDWVNDGLFGEGWSLFGMAMPGIPVFAEGLLTQIGCADWLQGLIIDGIIGGVGAVLGFVPQMLVLFLFLAFLEACGYMARIAFIMDRIFRRFGLSGKSFIPMLIGTGCGVPGIMASRTIESDRDRKMTIMTTTFIPCGAKMPIIALIAGALFNNAAWVATSAYFIGIGAIVVSGIILKKTKMLSGEAAPFVMELPAYHMPTVLNVGRSMWERGWSFIKKAGTVILLATIVIWFLSNFGFTSEGFGLVEEMGSSILAVIGGGIAWIFSPLGWGDWQSTVATITGLVAKEAVVGTFGVLYNFAEVAENGEEIWSVLAANFTQISAYSFLVFNLLCAPCFAAIGAIRREMNHWGWTWFAIGYQTVFAYAVSFCIYQIGAVLAGINGVGIGFWLAILVFLGFVYFLIRPQNREKRKERRNAIKEVSV